MSTAPARRKTMAGGHSGPRHVAIIMDGNGRWAKRRFLPRIMGHRKGVEAVRRVVEAAPDLGIEVLTLYAFSSENWKRPADEVSDLMGLLHEYLRKEIAELHAKGVRLSVIGDYQRLSRDLVSLIEHGMEMTRGNARLNLVLALNYGAQDEIVRATRAIAAAARAGRIDPDKIEAADVDSFLDTRDLPPPDLIVRTSGEVRLSNFMLWQAAYAELLFVDTLWPDFDADALAAAVESFAGRDRRYGAL
ncbi:di-trans,poly-cis-decaprenylcistransferase [Tardibacter chloracetimidivorans]|uniref:Isoprenyl transferase n=1 Tax=Tardibacter chloracetimidivorans TaxID=1921510 RepID=A0A1L3ZT61_9SPHN|nr:isoprenyl transferase [Tardibacter chloracetimidivorans]API58826.1 di-trans,poly-cis-decaprenylcistransferase [Tardibacter chloracetimidivorans]